MSQNSGQNYELKGAKDSCNLSRETYGCINIIYIYIRVFPKMVVPPKHLKMVIFSRKTNSIVVGYHHFRKPPYIYIYLYDLLRGHPRSLENNDLKLKLSHSVLSDAIPVRPIDSQVYKVLQNIASVVIALFTASGYLYLGSLTVSFHSMRHIVLSIHPDHIVEGPRSHDHDSDMIFDLQLGYGQFHGRLSLPTPLPLPDQKARSLN